MGRCLVPFTEDERRLRLLARQKIREGSLPEHVPPSVLAGPGAGDTCTLCNERIAPSDIEYEFRHEGRHYYMHLRCHGLWQLAVADRGGGDRA